MNSNYAPIVAFAYNRPNHLRSMLTSLQQSELASQSDLYIYCDGPKAHASAEDIERILAAREVAHNILGFKSVHVVEKERNEGLDPSEIRAVTEIVNRYGKVIVCEDDIILNKYFLRWMNDALDFYESEKKVMQVSGFSDNYEYLASMSRGGYSHPIAQKVLVGEHGKTDGIKIIGTKRHTILF